jgi:hypothetical protein
MPCRDCSTSSQAVSSASSSALVALAGVVVAPRESWGSCGWFFGHAWDRRVTSRRSSTGSWNFSDACRPSSVRIHWPLLLTSQPSPGRWWRSGRSCRSDGPRGRGVVALLERGRREAAFDLLDDPAGLQAVGVLLEDLEDGLQDLSGPLAGDLGQSSSPPGPAPYKGGRSSHNPWIAEQRQPPGSPWVIAGLARVEPVLDVSPHLRAAPPNHPHAADRTVLSTFPSTQPVIVWQVFWQAAPEADSGKVFVLVGATGIEPVTSAV